MAGLKLQNHNKNNVSEDTLYLMKTYSTDDNSDKKWDSNSI